MSKKADSLFYSLVPEVLHERITRHWHDWQASCESIEQAPLEGIEKAGIELALLGKIWACSEFIPQVMVRNPQLWLELLHNAHLQQSFSQENYQQLLNQDLQLIDSTNDIALMKQLRLFRQKQMLRIAWRDLANLADTQETLRNLTDLAETCIDIPLEILYQDQCKQLGVPCNSMGSPQRLVVLGMGKLGGYELNFSSDIDLIFCFDEEGETNGARALANSQFFIRLGQRFIKILNDITAEGFVFRVDMRLRPYGDSGPLVMSHAALEQYYQTQGRNWERYAMIKARVVAGDRVVGQSIMDMLKPFVYRRYLDFGAFESIREMKSLIDTEIRRKGNLNNIKLGSGGIREIEFIGQTFQLIRGGSEPELQIRGILAVLDLLAEKKYLSAQETQGLKQSYDFLRRLENRLQIYADAQTHLLPDDELQQVSMALAMGYIDWPSLLKDCDEHRESVHASFVQLLHETTEEESQQEQVSDSLFMKTVWLHELDEEEVTHKFEDLGMVEGAEIYRQLQQFRHASQLKSMSASGRQRLDMLMPKLLELLPGQAHPAIVFKRVIALFQSVLRRSVYLSLLNEYPNALKQLIDLCAASPWIAHLLRRYPVLLDELLDSRSLYQVLTPLKLKQQLEALLNQVENDQEQQIERLRKFKQTQVLKTATMDIAGVVDVFEVSDQLSNIAEILLEKVMALAWDWMVIKHGRPVCVINGENYYPSMGIVAYGKMGGMELGYGSDLDLVFLHDSQGAQQQTDGERALDNASFFARLAQRIIHLLSVQTANGRLYETDMRLRPDGNAGMLVSSLQAYENYQREKAWTWEHQALVRARMLCSSTHLKTEFDRIRRSILIQTRNREALASDVAQMRSKMRIALGSSHKAEKTESAKFHLKQDAGGLVDIEFIAQFGVLLCASQDESLIEYSATRKILGQLQACALLTSSQSDILCEAYKEYRAYSHQLALQELTSQIDKSMFVDRRAQVKKIWLDVLAKYSSEEVE